MLYNKKVSGKSRIFQENTEDCNRGDIIKALCLLTVKSYQSLLVILLSHLNVKKGEKFTQYAVNSCLLKIAEVLFYVSANLTTLYTSTTWNFVGWTQVHPPEDNIWISWIRLRSYLISMLRRRVRKLIIVCSYVADIHHPPYDATPILRLDYLWLLHYLCLNSTLRYTTCAQLRVLLCNILMTFCDALRHQICANYMHRMRFCLHDAITVMVRDGVKKIFTWDTFVSQNRADRNNKISLLYNQTVSGKSSIFKELIVILTLEQSKTIGETSKFVEIVLKIRENDIVMRDPN